VVGPGEINVLNHSPEGPGARRATRHSDKHNIRGHTSGDQHFAAADRCQLTRTQKAGESLQDFATAIEQLAHRAYSTLSEDHIRREAGKAFSYGVQDGGRAPTKGRRVASEGLGREITPLSPSL
jgi:hypothetical protein